MKYMLVAFYENGENTVLSASMRRAMHYAKLAIDEGYDDALGRFYGVEIHKITATMDHERIVQAFRLKETK